MLNILFGKETENKETLWAKWIGIIQNGGLYEKTKITEWGK